jgi:hypothetical protein
MNVPVATVALVDIARVLHVDNARKERRTNWAGAAAPAYAALAEGN